MVIPFSFWKAQREIIPANVVLTFTSGSADDLVTTTNLESNTIRAASGGTWSYAESRTPSHTRLTAEENVLPWSLSCNGGVYSGIGAKSFRFDITERNSGVLNWDGLRFSIPAGVGDLAMAFAIEIDTTEPSGSDSVLDLLQILSDKFAIAQVAFYAGGPKRIRSHGQTSTSTSGPNVNYSLDTKYSLLLFHSQSAGRSVAIVLDSTGAFIAASQCAITSASDIVALQITDYLLAPGNGTLKLGIGGVFWGGNENTLLAHVSVPAVSSLTALQVEEGEVLVSWASKATRWKVEQSSTGGSSWTTLDASFESARSEVADAVEYTVTGLTDGATYLYRITPYVLTQAGPANTSSSIAINDAPYAGPGDLGPGDGNITGLVALWRFNEGTGTSAADATGNGLAGSVSNATWTTGHLSGALDFSPGSDSYVQVADNDLLDFTTAWTFALWANFDTIATGNNVGRWFLGKDEATGRSYTFGTIGDGTDAKMCVQLNGNTYRSDGSAVQSLTGAWHHFVVTYDSSAGASALKFYIDGVLDGTSSGETPSVTGTAFRLGARGYSGYHDTMDGRLDDVKLFNRALSGAEITAEAAR